MSSTSSEVRGWVVNLQAGAPGFEGVTVVLSYELVSAGQPRRASSLAVPVGIDGAFTAELLPLGSPGMSVFEGGRIGFALLDRNGAALPVSDVRMQTAPVGAPTTGSAPTPTKTTGLGAVSGNPDRSIPVSSVAAGGSVVVSTAFENRDNLVSATPQVLVNAPARPNQKLRGKVVDQNAKLKLRDNQVIVSGVPEGGSVPTVLGVAVTDKDGNFSLPYAYGKYKSAFAVVSIKPEQTLDIVLTPTQELPEFVWLVVEGLPDTLTQAEHDDCACAAALTSVPVLPDMEELVGGSQYSQDIGSSCVNFTTPNRSLEEFAYTQVVRTSDPELYNPARYKLEDRLSWVKLRVVEIQKQLGGFSSFPPRHLAQVGSLNALDEDGPAPQERLSGVGTGSPIGEPPAVLNGLSGVALVQRGLEQQSEATTGYLQSGVYNKSASALQRELQILRTERDRLERLLTGMGRVPLSGRHPIDWDDSDGKLGTVQASTIAYGHILYLKQVWRAAGYSLGDLLYSLPLAPGQKKQIAVMEWDRKETASRLEQLDAADELSNTLVHDRDINEIVKANLSENMSASSHSSASGSGGGLGVGLGSGSSGGASGSYGGINLLAGFSNMLGISGGFSKSKGESSSNATQDANRSLFSASEQSLRDRTMQNASSVRSQRASVVTTVGQSESFRFTTEVIANHNHCHAVTIQYFEVLRHFAVHHELADVQECLFVPFLIEDFDRRKILRWRDVLSSYLFAPKPQLRQLKAGFDALQREEDALHGDALAYSAFPQGRYCDENLQELSGDLSLRLHVAKPDFVLPPDTADYSTIYNQVLGALASSQLGLGWWASGARTVAEKLAKQIFDKTERDRMEETFQNQLAYENFVNDFCKTLRVQAILQNNPGHKVDLHLDVTIIANNNWFKNDKANIKRASQAGAGVGRGGAGRTGEYVLALSLRPTGATHTAIAGLKRADIARLEITAANLPFGSSCMIQSGSMGYQTAHHSGRLFSSSSIQNDIAGDDAVLIPTPLVQEEMRNPRYEDRKNARLLEQHLDAHKEYYHKLLWAVLDEQRLFNLLDKYTIQVPRLRYKTYVDDGMVKTGLQLDGAGKPVVQYETRSVASVVQHKRIGFAGNSVIFPVAKGLNVNRDFLLVPNYVRSVSDKTLGVLTDQVAVDLIDFYKPAPGTRHEPKPFRISVPTKGLFAEAVSGACNSCEKIDDSRFWKWEEHPIDEPTAIEPVSTQTRRTDPGDLSAKDFASPIVNIQNAPTAPDPVGLSKALDLLGKSDAFRDITGLSETQKNALQALVTSSGAATQYATLAQQLANKAGDNSLEAMKAMSAHDKERRSSVLEGLSKLQDSNLDSDTKADFAKKAFEQLFGSSPQMGEMSELLQQAEQTRQANASKGKYDDALKVLDKVGGSQKVEVDTDGSVTVEQPVVGQAQADDEVDFYEQLAWLEEIDFSGISDSERWAYLMAIMKAQRDGVKFESKEALLQSIME